MQPIAVRCLHPGLVFDRGAVIRALRILDGRRADLSTPDSVLGEPGELSVAFLTDSELARLHGSFLDDPAATDVITFPGIPGTAVAGEICISADAAARQVRPDRAGRLDFSRELTLYLVHGWLHLAGHDDRTPKPRRAMRRAEARAMAALAAGRAIPRFALRKRPS